MVDEKFKKRIINTLAFKLKTIGGELTYFHEAIDDCYKKEGNEDMFWGCVRDAAQGIKIKN